MPRQVPNLQKPTELPLASKSKKELVRIIELMSEDMQWYVYERNRLLKILSVIGDEIG